MQRLGGKIEEVTCKDLIDLSQDLYYLILQKLKEKALDLNTRIDEWRNQEISTTERNDLNIMEKDLIKGGFRDSSHFSHILCSDSEELVPQYPILPF